MIELPKGIRIPRDDEYPQTKNPTEINQRREAAKIVEGYTLKAAGEDEVFTHYIEANIDNSRLWQGFWMLVASAICDPAYAVFGFKDEEYEMTDYIKVNEIKRVYSLHQFSLTQDGYLAFGVAQKVSSSFCEILVDSFKYLKIWTSDLPRIETTLSALGIELVPDLAFIDQFPVVSQSLADSDKGIPHSVEVIRLMTDEFERIKNGA